MWNATCPGLVSNATTIISHWMSAQTCNRSRDSVGLVTKLCANRMIPWTAAHQAPLSMGFPRQQYWSGLPFLPPGDLPHPGLKPSSPTLQVDSLPLSYPGNPQESPSQMTGCGLMSQRPLLPSSLISPASRPPPYSSNTPLHVLFSLCQASSRSFSKSCSHVPSTRRPPLTT